MEHSILQGRVFKVFVLNLFCSFENGHPRNSRSWLEYRSAWNRLCANTINCCQLQTVHALPRSATEAPTTLHCGLRKQHRKTLMLVPLGLGCHHLAQWRMQHALCMRQLKRLRLEY